MELEVSIECGEGYDAFKLKRVAEDMVVYATDYFKDQIKLDFAEIERTLIVHLVDEVSGDPKQKGGFKDFPDGTLNIAIRCDAQECFAESFFHEIIHAVVFCRPDLLDNYGHLLEKYPWGKMVVFTSASGEEVGILSTQYSEEKWPEEITCIYLSNQMVAWIKKKWEENNPR